MVHYWGMDTCPVNIHPLLIDYLCRVDYRSDCETKTTDKMREIKFRAFSVLDNKMIYESDIEEWSDDNIMSYKNLMQYTGLKDKNGKEIYEGDILKETWSNSNGEHERVSKVIYEAPLFRIDAEELWYNKTDMERAEVIGNICETPELLT